MNDYLWDKSGTPDPFVEELERALSPLRAPDRPPPKVRTRFVARSLPIGFAVAAMALFVVVERDTSLQMSTAGNTSRIAVGQVVETAAETQIDLGDHGVVNLRERARLRLVENTKRRQELFLERGELHAIVNAPPRFFTVGTPVVRAVDLGCEYTLAVDERTGTTVVIVQTGAVALESEDRITLVPAGAAARADRGADALPYAMRTSSEMRAAAESGDVARIVQLAQRVDAITLWHLAQQRRDESALKRLNEVFPPPEGIDVTTVAGMFTWLDAIEADLVNTR